MRISIPVAAALMMSTVPGLAAEKVWIVVDLIQQDGRPSQMAIDNPAVPDMTVADCESVLNQAVPSLMQGIQSQSQTAKSKYIGANCVESAKDLVKPE